MKRVTKSIPTLVFETTDGRAFRTELEAHVHQEVLNDPENKRRCPTCNGTMVIDRAVVLGCSMGGKSTCPFCIKGVQTRRWVA